METMIKIELYIFLLVLCYMNHCKCCTQNQNLNRYECKSFDEVAQEGSVTWKTLFVFNSNITEDSHIRLSPKYLAGTPNLNELIIHGWLKFLEHDAISSLQRLEKLIIYNNKIIRLQSSALGHTGIRDFQFVNNSITSLPEGLFRHAYNLRDVQISKNNLYLIPAGVFSNTSIEKLYLTHNQIESIEHGAFFNMRYLSLLSLAANNLKTFNLEPILNKNNLLQYLVLSGNLLESVNADMFQGLTHLTHCSLDLNQIRSIEEDSFSSTTDLKYLDLANNLLTTLNVEIFSRYHMRNLSLIFLNNNRLTYLDLAIFKRLPVLSYISYGGNPFQCPCLEVLDKFVREKNIILLCDDEYRRGSRPTCVINSIFFNTCVQDNSRSEEFYNVYKQQISKYSKLNLTCDYSKGIDKAQLIKSQWEIR